MGDRGHAVKSHLASIRTVSRPQLFACNRSVRWRWDGPRMRDIQRAEGVLIMGSRLNTAKVGNVWKNPQLGYTEYFAFDAGLKDMIREESGFGDHDSALRFGCPG